MAILAVAEMYNNANQVEEVFRVWLCRIAEMFDVVQPDVDGFRECKMFVDFLPTEVGQVEVESFEVEDQTVWC